MIKVGKVIIGWSLEAALLAFYEHCPLIICSERKHTIRDFVDLNLDLSLFSVENKEIELTTNFGLKRIGLHKKDIIDYILYMLSLCGLLYKGSVLINDNTVEFFGKNNFSKIFEPKEIIVVDPDDVQSIQVESESIIYEVYDWSSLQAITEYDLIFSGYKKFCQEIWFFDASDSHNSLIKDCVLVSFLNEEEVNDPNYGDHIMRLMGADILKEKNITKNIEYHKREVVKNIDFKCQNYDNIQFKTELKIEEIFSQEMSQKTQDFLKLYARS